MKNRSSKHLFLTAITTFILLVIPASATSASATKGMNLILVVADDLAQWPLSAYGNREFVTPNIDQLAADGVLFSNAFATSPVCTPARLQVMTGLESFQVGSLNDATSGAPLGSLPYGVPSWARDLQTTGYKTAYIGKWHLGHKPEHSPTRYGFDYFFGFRGGANRAQNPFLARGEGEHTPVKGYTDDLLVDDAIRYLESNGNAPFVLSLNLRAPHLPYLPMPDEDARRIEKLDPVPPALGDPRIPGAREVYRDQLIVERRNYYGVINTVDRNMGRLMAALRRLDLTDNTIIIFTSDNGYLLGERGLFNKGPATPIQYYMYPDNRLLWAINMWDLSIRIPMIVRWPGVAEAGKVIDRPVTLIDLYRTIRGMLKTPLASDSPIGGMDFSKLIRKPDMPWREAVFGQYTSDRIGNLEFVRMIRTDRWKLVLSYLNPSANRLYDLQKDPQELTNLYHGGGLRLTKKDNGTMVYETTEDKMASIRNSLEKRLRDWQRSVNDPALELEASYTRHKHEAIDRWQR